MDNYYAKHLHATRLLLVYQTDIERVRQYLDAEIAFVRGHLTGSERVLELGAGYGRILRELAPFAASLVGIDISEDSVALGRSTFGACRTAPCEPWMPTTWTSRPSLTWCSACKTASPP